MQYYILIILAILASCTSKQTKIIDLDLNDKSSDLSYSSIFTNIKYIDLEWNDTCLISTVEQFHKDDSLLFFLDKRSKCIFIFNEQGKYISKIDCVGKGPGEYISITSFCLDREMKRVYLLDSPQRKFIKFDYKGVFLSEQNFSRSLLIRSLAFLHKKYICFTPDYMKNGKVGVWEMDTLGNYKKELKGVDPKYQYPGHPFPYYTSYKKDLICFYDSNTEEIFSLSENGLNKAYQINLLQKMPTEYHTKATIVRTNKGPVWGIKDYYRIHDIAECETAYFLTYQSRLREKTFVFFSKMQNKLLISDHLKNDFDKNPAGDQIFSFSKNQFMIVKYNEDRNPQLQILKVK